MAVPGSVGAERQRLVRAVLASHAAEAAGPLVAVLPTATPDELRVIVEGIEADEKIGAAAIAPLLAMITDASVPQTVRLAAVGIVGRVHHGDRSEALWALDEDARIDGQNEIRAAIVRAVGE